MKTLLIPLLLSLFSLPPHPPAESASFQIIYRDRMLGELSASKTRVGKQDIYVNHTLISTRIIRQIEVAYKTRVVFEEGLLQEAEISSTLNGDPYSHTLTKREGKVYRFYKEGKLKKSLDQPITCSSVMLLFDEPANIRSIYSEEGGEFFDIEPGGAGNYHKVNSKGRKNTYHYENQDLMRIDIDAGIVEFDIIRKP